MALACLPKLKCFKKEDGSDMIHKSNAAVAAAAETKEPKTGGRQMDDGRMDHCAKWLRKVSAVAEYEESYLHSQRYLQPSKNYLNNLNSRVCHRQSLGNLAPEGLDHVSDKMAALNIGGESRDDFKYPYVETSASTSDISSISSCVEFKQKKRKKLRPRSGHSVSRHLASQRRLSDASDTTSDSTFSLRTESVVLDLEKAGTNLGISIVGHRNRNGDQGIFVGTVRRDSVAFASGRIRPGSCLLEVNGHDLTQMSNEGALRTVRTEAQKRGPLHLVLGRFWDVTSKNDDLEESILEDEGHRPQELARLTYVQPNICQPTRESLMDSSCNSIAPSTYIVAPPINALTRPINAQASIPIRSSKSSDHARRRSDRMRNELRSTHQQMSNPVEDHSSIHTRRHSLPGILEPEPNYSECLPLPPSLVPPRPYDPRFEGLSAAEGYAAYTLHRMQSRALALDSPPQTLFRGIDLIEWVTNQFSSHIGGISARTFSQHLLEKGAIVDVGESGNSTEFSENGYYVIVSSQLSDKQIVI